MKRILLTGAAGGVGTEFRRYAKRYYRLRCLDRVPVPGEKDAVVADLTDERVVREAAKECDAVVHLAATRDEADFMSEILPNNIAGTFNVYEAARRAMIRKFVFVSSMQVENGYGWGNGRRVTTDMPALPTSFYGASKVLGENLGESYASRFNMSVVALRLGWVAVPTDPEWVELIGSTPPWETITVRDTNEILRHAIEAGNVRFSLLHAFSRNARRRRDLEPLKKILGYYPKDDAVKLHRQGRFFTSPRNRRR